MNIFDLILRRRRALAKGRANDVQEFSDLIAERQAMEIILPIRRPDFTAILRHRTLTIHDRFAGTSHAYIFESVPTLQDATNVANNLID